MEGHQIRSLQDPADAPPRPTYTGPVSVTPMFTDGTADMRCSIVQFGAAARTGWHRHDGAQVLVGAGGEGLLVSEDGTVLPIHDGVVVHVPAGERHWHGASRVSGMIHLALTVGQSHYEAEVTDAEHTAAAGGLYTADG